MKVWIAHEAGRAHLGALPAGVAVDVCDGHTLPGDPAEVAFWVPPFTQEAPGPQLLPQLTGVEVVQLLSAGADAWVDHMPDGVRLCDARGVHDAAVAEWTLGAVIGALRGFPKAAHQQERGVWRHFRPTRELTGARVLLVGAGSIGRAIEQRLAPFGVTVTRVARTARPAEDVHGVDALPGLLPSADIVILIVPLTDATYRMVDAAFLAALPDGALVVNAARGPVVDTDALVAELSAGRLTAALDVTDPEPLPAGHPLWALPNALITPHIGSAVHGTLPRAYTLAGDQIRRVVAGAEPINLVTGGY